MKVMLRKMTFQIIYTAFTTKAVNNNNKEYNLIPTAYADRNFKDKPHVPNTLGDQ